MKSKYVCQKLIRVSNLFRKLGNLIKSYFYVLLMSWSISVFLSYAHLLVGCFFFLLTQKKCNLITIVNSTYCWTILSPWALCHKLFTLGAPYIDRIYYCIEIPILSHFFLKKTYTNYNLLDTGITLRSRLQTF